MIDIKEIYSEMLKQEKYLEEQNFNDEQIMVIGKLIANKEYLLKKQIEKKDRVIDLMCEQLAGIAIWNNEKQEPDIYMDKEEVKSYFEKEASKDESNKKGNISKRKYNNL